MNSNEFMNKMNSSDNKDSSSKRFASDAVLVKKPQPKRMEAVGSPSHGFIDIPSDSDVRSRSTITRDVNLKIILFYF